jgi:methionyl-tRNA formyltransferase
VKLFFFGNNRVALELLRFLLDEGEQLVGLALHPSERSRFREELLDTSGFGGDVVFEEPALHDPGTVDRIRALDAELGVSVLYDYVIPAELIAVFPRGVVNLQPSLLPWNRGRHSNVWSIVEGTPAGITLHWLDERVHAGDVIAQREVPVESVDTGATLYWKLESAMVSLFRESWPALRDGTAPRRQQDTTAGTVHGEADVEAIDRIELDAPTTARKLLDVLRARTFRPYESAYFESADGRKVYVRLDLDYGDEA